jgi:hypothetical protein
MRTCMVYILLIVSLQAHAAIYKWTDSKGQIHYGDKPNKAPDTKELNVDTSNTSGILPDDANRDERRKRLLDVMQEDRQEREQQRKKEQAKQEQRHRRCVYLRDRLRNIKNATGVYQLDDNGKRVFLSNQDRKQSEVNLQQQINQYCN